MDNSQKYYNDYLKARELLFKLNDNINLEMMAIGFAQKIDYNFNGQGLAMCGTTYQKDKKIITIEFHLGEADLNSIAIVCNEFIDNINKFKKNHPKLATNIEINQAMKVFNQTINSKFYVVLPVYAINGQIQNSESEIKYFSKDKTPSEIENWCISNLNQFII